MDIERRKTLETACVATSRDNGDRLSQLPLGVRYEILKRVDTETVFSCVCVCKTFCDDVTDPHFAELYLAREPNIDSGLIIQDRINFSDVVLAYDYKHDIEGGSTSSTRPCQTFSLPTIAADRVYYVYTLGTCNGLLCVRFLVNILDFHYYICNPVLGEFLALPLDKEPVKSVQPSGFGFCPTTKQYKVLRFLTSSCCKILTLGTDDDWRMLRTPLPYPLTPASFDSSFKGNLHWIIDSDIITSDNLICSFNLETEQSSILPTPTHLIHLNYFGVHPLNHSQNIISYVQTGSFGGLFCLGYILNSRYYQICVMKDYGVKESWTIDFHIDFTLIPGLEPNMSTYVSKFSNSGDLFFKGVTKSVVCYNLHKGTLTSLLAKNVGLVDVTPFLPSLISLKNIIPIALCGNLEVVQRRMGHNLWSDEGFHFIA